MKPIHTLILLALVFTHGACSGNRKPISAMQIRQVMIFVGDLDKAREFYCGALGLPIEHDLSDELGMFIIKHEGCILTIHGNHQEHPYREGRKVVVAFGVKNLEREVQRLKAAGVEMLGEIEETPVHRYQAFLDPSGNMIEIGEYKSEKRNG